MHHMVSVHCSYVLVSWEGTETEQEATGTIWNMGNFNWIRGKYFCYVGDQAPKDVAQRGCGVSTPALLILDTRQFAALESCSSRPTRSRGFGPHSLQRPNTNYSVIL